MNWTQESGLLILRENENILGYVSRSQSGYYYSTENPLIPQTSITLRGLGKPFTLDQAKNRLIEVATKKQNEGLLLESN